MFEQDASDPLGKFGRFADAFDVSTAMPLVVYLATEADVGERLVEALDALESFILRKDSTLPTAYKSIPALIMNDAAECRRS